MLHKNSKKLEAKMKDMGVVRIEHRRKISAKTIADHLKKLSETLGMKKVTHK